MRLSRYFFLNELSYKCICTKSVYIKYLFSLSRYCGKHFVWESTVFAFSLQRSILHYLFFLKVIHSSTSNMRCSLCVVGRIDPSQKISFTTDLSTLSSRGHAFFSNYEEILVFFFCISSRCLYRE